MQYGVHMSGGGDSRCLGVGCILEASEMLARVKDRPREHREPESGNIALNGPWGRLWRRREREESTKQKRGGKSSNWNNKSRSGGSETKH